MSWRRDSLSNPVNSQPPTSKFPTDQSLWELGVGGWVERAVFDLTTTQVFVLMTIK
jgi:hypothetical protein